MEERHKDIPEEYKNRTIYSISRLHTFHNCPHSYYLGYIQRKQGVNNIYALLGGETHSILEEMQFGKISKEEGFKRFKEKAFELMAIQGYKFPSEKIEKNFMESIYQYFTSYEPVDCRDFKSEMRFFIEIENIVLTGFIDAVVLNNNNTVEVIDYKTSSKYGKEELEQHGQQLQLYALAIQKNFGIKVEKVKFDMLKYCWIRWNGKTAERKRFVQRNEIVKKLHNELKKDLKDEKKSDFEIEMLLGESESKNDLSILGQAIKNKYSITNGYVEVEYNEEVKNKLIEFIVSTVKEIEGKNTDDEEQWKPREITPKDNFFCSNLCSYKKHCKEYSKFLDDNKDLFENKTNDDLLNKIFGGI